MLFAWGFLLQQDIKITFLYHAIDTEIIFHLLHIKRMVNCAASFLDLYRDHRCGREQEITTSDMYLCSLSKGTMETEQTAAQASQLLYITFSGVLTLSRISLWDQGLSTVFWILAQRPDCSNFIPWDTHKCTPFLTHCKNKADVQSY